MNSHTTSKSESTKAFVYDAACVLALVVIGTRNHDTDTGVTGVLFVALPFWIALSASRILPVVRRSPQSTVSAAATWVTTVACGMILRHFIFDRGTATAFVVVASVFLAFTMFGWREVADRLARR